MNKIADVRRANLRFLIEREGLSSVARRAGKPDRQLNDMVAGRKSFGEKVARDIESHLDPSLKPGWLDQPTYDAGAVPAATLLAVAELLSLSANVEPAKHPARSEPASVSPSLERVGRVPLISWVQAGDWSHAADLLHPGEALEWIDTGVRVRPHTFALRVEGDSMEPEFAPGTILVVEPEMDAHPGDFVIAKNGDDEATFKQLVRDGADLYLKPLNARYPIKPLGHSRIVGVVREAVKRYR